MRTLLSRRIPAQLENNSLYDLTAAERRHVALASLAIQEQRYKQRLVEIQFERRALLASAGETL
jgi:hypothetical protein